jgi:hypothetical protein
MDNHRPLTWKQDTVAIPVATIKKIKTKACVIIADANLWDGAGGMI